MPKNVLLNILKNNITELHPKDKTILLEEANNKTSENTLKSITITGVPNDALVLKADMATMSIFKEDSIFKKYRKQCDYIIITELDNQGYIFYLEMKSRTRLKTYIQQLWCSRSLMEYLNFSIKNLDGISPAFDHYQHRYVKFDCINLDKDTTNPKDTFKTNTQEQKIKNDKPGSAYIHTITPGERPINLKELIFNP